MRCSSQEEAAANAGEREESFTAPFLEEKAVMLSVDDLAAPSWPEGGPHHRKVRFRGECEALGQLSMLSVMDSEEGCASVSWTDVVCG